MTTSAHHDATEVTPNPDWDVIVLGGGGHVGLPLSIALADRGARVLVLDISQAAVDQVNSGTLPFRENGAGPVLRRVLDAGRLRATTDPAAAGLADTVIVVIGTPVDEHLNPDPHAIPRSLSAVSEHMRDGQLVILRSTVYPGVTQLVERTFARQGLDVDIAFCPERIAEGHAMTELYSLPQIVGARSDRVRKRATDVFSLLTDKIVDLDPEEAELAKLFTNNWRYLKFAAANQFYMIANSHGLDFERIRSALVEDYPRAQDLPRAGFAAGPCLFKDTMQLAAFNDNNYFLGHSAMLVNEGLPLYVVQQLEARQDLSEMTVGILGMAFKAQSDDVRSSLSYKLKRILGFRAKAVLCTDPYVTTDADLLPLEQVLADADLLVIGAPHTDYLDLQTDKPVADVWNLLGGGVQV
ncbi:MAG: UDP-N-acetyl-D-mannosaminuronic acid dehydrogenase [Pseudonocardiales bacterium]|nr:UDP-N-acetyl-D-mannosaminuronic acid dehydrogenase [Pseudonocardiales bacterium]